VGPEVTVVPVGPPVLAEEVTVALESSTWPAPVLPPTPSSESPPPLARFELTEQPAHRSAAMVVIVASLAVLIFIGPRRNQLVMAHISA